MDDLISRQAVINEMKDMYTAAEEWAQGAHDDDTRARAESCMATNVELKLRIEKLPSVQPQRWIPVSERLPEHSGFYIVTAIVTDDGDKLVGLRWFSQEQGWKFGKNPLAWMPLPEPWRGQDETD